MQKIKEENQKGKSLKNDRLDNKNMYELLPLDVIDDLVKVLTYGASKYAVNSWQNLENGEDRYFAACMRHLVAHRTGEHTDSESGLSHLSHALCNIVFMTYLNKKQKQ